MVIFIHWKKQTEENNITFSQNNKQKQKLRHPKTRDATEETVFRLAWRGEQKRKRHPDTAVTLTARSNKPLTAS